MPVFPLVEVDPLDPAEPNASLLNALVSTPGLEDFAILPAREQSPGRVAVVLDASFEADWRSRLPALPGTHVYLRVNRIPLLLDGRVDQASLQVLPLLEPATVERWNLALGFVPGLRQGVVLEREVREPLPRLHREDLCPAPLSAKPTAANLVEKKSAVAVSGVTALSQGPTLEAELPRNLVAALQRAARVRPTDGLIYLDRAGTEARQGYAELLEEASHILSGLRAAGLVAGDPVLIQTEACRDFIPALWGCILGGMVPVPLSIAPSYRHGNGALSKLFHAWRLLDCAPILADHRLSEALRTLPTELLPEEAQAEGTAGLRLLDLDELRGFPATDQFHDAEPEERLEMLLTSGSTGLPKAVVHTHRMVLARSAGTAQLNGFTAEDVSLNWFPLDHVGGVVMFHLRDVYLAATQLNAPTDAVLEDPLRWLDWIEKYRCTITWAPNFAYGLVIEALEREVGGRKRDLSSMRFILNAGEAIVARCARRFMQVLAPHGLPDTSMKPAWGMSETSSAVAYSERFHVDTTSDDDAFVEVGRPIPEAAFRIVDVNDQLLTEGEVGRLQVRGITVLGGYFSNPALNPQINNGVFTADGWFKTGDLGVLREGRLTITGREKDLIIVNGLNLYSHEIESVVEQVPGVEVSFTAATAVRFPGDSTDRIGLFFVPADPQPEAVDELLPVIRAQVLERIGVNPDFLVPVTRDEVPKTAIGKIQRSQLRQQLEAGEFRARLRELDLRTGGPSTLPDWFLQPCWQPRQIVRTGASALDAILTDGSPLAGSLARRVDDSRSFDEPTAFTRQLAVERSVPADEAGSLRAVAFLGEADHEAALAQALSAPSVLSGGEDLHLLAVNASSEAVQHLSRLSAPHRNLRLTFLWADAETDPQQLLSEFSAPGIDDFVTYRAGERLVRRLKPLALEPLTTGTGMLRRGGRYVITGTRPAAGAALADHLQQRWEASVLLLPAEEASVSLAAPEAEGSAPLDGWFHLDTTAEATPSPARANLAASTTAFFCRLSSLAEPAAGPSRVLAPPTVADPSAIHYLTSPWECDAVSEDSHSEGGVLRLPVRDALASLEALLQRSVPHAVVGLDRSHPTWASLTLALPHPAAELAAFLSGGDPGAARRALRHVRIADCCQVPVPCHVVTLPDLPRLPDGGVDHQALRSGRFGIASAEAAPESGTEQLLAEIWQEVLGVSRIHRSSNFFHLGGQSLLAAKVLARAKSLLGADLALRHLFATPDLAGLAATADAALLEAVGAERLETCLSDYGLPCAGTSDPEDLLRRLKRLTADQRRSLAQGLNAGEAQYPLLPVARQEGPQRFPLSSAQQRLWFLERWGAGNPAYIQLFRYELSGTPDVNLLEQCLQELVQRHEPLRTLFEEREGEPCQVVHPTMPLALLQEDLSSNPEPEDAAWKRVREEGARAFDLEHGPLLRARFLRLAEGRSWLLVTMHHVVTDGWSATLLTDELVRLYQARHAGQPSPLAPLPLQYADFSAWQREWLSSPPLRNSMAYWKERLAAPLPVLELPSDRPRPALLSYRGAREWLHLPAEVAERLRSFSERQGVTPFITLFAVFHALLVRYTGQRDLVVGTPVANRQRLELEPMLGYFTNSLPLRAQLPPDATFLQTLERVKESVLAGFAHQEAPFERLVEELQPERDPSRPPLFQVMFQLMNVPVEQYELPGCTLTGDFQPDNGSSKFDLTLQVSESAKGLALSAEYSTDLYEADRMRRLLQHYRVLLDAALASPAALLTELSLLTPAEQETMRQWNATRSGWNHPECLHAVVERWAERRPQAEAVVCGKDRLTYGELNAQANQLAYALLSRGVTPGTLIGLCSERSVDVLVGMLGILKAGGAYVPLDPAYPAARLTAILEDGAPAVLVCGPGCRERLPECAIPTVELRSPSLQRFPDKNPVTRVAPDHLAYVIFTSGSTGRPKGVMVEHASVTHLVQTAAPRFGFTEEDTWTVFHSYSFDFSVWEIWGALLTGARLVVVPQSATRSPRELFTLLREERVTVLNLTPTAHRTLAEVRDGGQEGLPALRFIGTGGEALPGTLVPTLLEWGVPLWNFYGPTECTVWAAIHPVSAEDAAWSAVPVGRPLPDNYLYVLDAQGQPLPAGIPGELCIGGPGVARGYLNRADLTTERFLPDAFAPEASARLYRTGDLARFRPDGVVEFLGRNDHQVKIRGFRIELGEIEAVLAAQPGVTAATAIVREDAGGSRILAYVERADGVELETSQLRAAVEQALPAYMTPSVVMVLDRLPLSPNGKVDRAALPSPESARVRTGGEAPKDELELRLSRIWRSVLQVPSVAREDSFFELGGHSLLALKLLSRIQQEFDRDLPVAALFQAPTLSGMASVLRNDGWESRWTSLVPLQPAGDRPPLFLIHGGGAYVMFYQPLCARLGDSQPVYGLQPINLSGKHAPHERIEDMAAHYLSEIRTVQPEGPYYLGGASYGGRIALEIAQQLEEQGDRAALVAFFDTYGPDYPRLRPGTTPLHRLAGQVVRKLEHHVGSYAGLPREQRGAYVREKTGKALTESWEAIDQLTRSGAKRVRHLVEPRKRIETAQGGMLEALHAYQPRSYSGRITLFRAERQPPGAVEDRYLGWEPYGAGGIDVIDVPGYHAAMISEPRVRVLAVELERVLHRLHAAEAE